MIACAAKSILMGKRCIPGTAGAHGIVQLPVSKLSPLWWGNVNNVGFMAGSLTPGCLRIFERGGEKGGQNRAKIDGMDMTKSHSRHLSADRCRKIGMTVEMMEGKKNHELQDAVLSLHHACMLTLGCGENFSSWHRSYAESGAAEPISETIEFLDVSGKAKINYPNNRSTSGGVFRGAGVGYVVGFWG